VVPRQSRPYIGCDFLMEVFMTVVFIHGFSAKKEDNEYLINYLKEKHIKVKTIDLVGHKDNKVERLPYKKWLDEAEKSLKEIIKKEKNIILIGHSMGGAISTILAERYHEIKKLILLAPAFNIGSITQNKEDLFNIIKGNVNQEYKTGFEGVLKKTRMIPFSDLYEVKKLGKLAFKSLEKVKCKTLILHGTLDQVVCITSSIKAYACLNAKKHFTLLMNVRHQMLKGYKKEEISKYIYYYIKGGIMWNIKKQNQI
jgi:hypothetical protein